MKKFVYAIALLIAVFSISVSAQTAAKVTDDLYAKLTSLNVRGLPDNDQLSALSPFLSDSIVAQIKRDQRKQDAFIKKHPDEKPPWAEGDLFSSLFEGPTAYTIGRSRVVSGSTYVDVKLVNDSTGDKTSWTDTAILKKFGGKWRITNILFTGKWQFKNGSSLLNVLK